MKSVKIVDDSVKKSLNDGESRSENFERFCQKNITLFLFFRFINGFSFAIRSAGIFDIYVLRLSRTNVGVGFLSLCIGISAVLSGSIAGIIFDKYHKYITCHLRFLALSSGLCIICNYAAIEYDSYNLVIISNVLWGAWHEAVFVATDVLLVDSVPQGFRSRYFMLKRLVMMVANAAGPFLAILYFGLSGDSWSDEGIHSILKFGVVICIPQMLVLWDWHSVKVVHDDATILNGDIATFVPITAEVKPVESKINAVKIYRCKKPTRRKFFFLTIASIPWIVIISNIVVNLGSGMTNKFFLLYLNSELAITPVISCLISSSSRLASAFGIYFVQKGSLITGRAWAAIISLSLAILSTTGIYFMRNLVLLILLFLSRCAFQSGPIALDKSILIDFTPLKNRGKWVAVDSFLSIIWSVSVFIGGYLADLISYDVVFLSSAIISTLGCIIYIPVLFLVPKEEMFTEDDAGG